MMVTCVFVQAQSNFKLSGRVQDASKGPVDMATVILFRMPDSVVFRTTFTEADGRFQLENIREGSYYIRITAMGYVSYEGEPFLLNPSDPPVQLEPVILNQAAKNIAEVNVTGQKAIVVRKIDRTIVNVDALISNAGISAFEVLEKSPGVSIDQNGMITLKGKQGVTVFIDDKPTYMSGKDLEDYLKSLPSSSIEQIELMTNPPARYDAAGNAGVINIKTKRSSLKGFNGGLNLAYTQGKMNRTNNSFNFNYRNNKINILGNLSQAYQSSFTDLDLNRKYKNADESPRSFFNQNSYIRRYSAALNTKIGLDYYLSEKTTWGIVLSGSGRSSRVTNDNVSKLLNAAGETDSSIVARSKETGKFHNGGVNLNYRHQFDKNGHDLSFDGDYLTYRSKNDQLYNNSSYFADNTLKSNDQLSGKLPSSISIYSFKTDYVKPIIDDWKFSTGLKTSYTETDNTADYSYTTGGVTQPDYDKSNHFIYKENIQAAYLNMSREGKKISVQAGLRAEHTLSDGNQLGNLMKPDSAFKRTYTSVFPTMYLSYKFDTLANNQLGLNYGRRIDRPYYQDLNPFISPLDKFTYYLGNPFLKPAYSQSIELSHTYKNRITTALSYSREKDNVGETIEIRDGIYYSRPFNIGRRTIKSISVDAGFDPAKWVTLHMYSEYTSIHSVSDFYTGTLDTKGSFLFANLQAQFTLGKGWSTELSGMYRSKIYDAQFVIGAFGMLNLGVQKKISPAMTARLQVNDILYSRIINGQINNLALTEASWKNRTDSRVAVLSFSYRFGKAIAGQRQHDASGADTEKQRVK